MALHSENANSAKRLHMTWISYQMRTLLLQQTEKEYMYILLMVLSMHTTWIQ